MRTDDGNNNKKKNKEIVQKLDLMKNCAYSNSYSLTKQNKTKEKRQQKKNNNISTQMIFQPNDFGGAHSSHNDTDKSNGSMQWNNLNYAQKKKKNGS